MEQYSGKKVLFILTGSTFLLLALVFNIPNNQKNSKASASVCIGESQLEQIALEFKALQEKAKTMPEYTPPTMLNIIPTSPTNYQMTVPTPIMFTPATYTPAMPAPIMFTPPTYNNSTNPAQP